MKCPYCNEEMDQGFIQCRDELSWSPKKRAVAALPAVSSKSIDLATEFGALSGRAALAHNCTTCKKIIIDYQGRPEKIY